MSWCARPDGDGVPCRRIAMAASASAQDWVKEDQRRMLHVVYRVGDMQKHVDFYTKQLGMKLLRSRDIPEDKYSNAFLGYGPEETNFAGTRRMMHADWTCSAAAQPAPSRPLRAPVAAGQRRTKLRGGCRLRPCRRTWSLARGAPPACPPA